MYKYKYMYMFLKQEKPKMDDSEINKTTLVLKEQYLYKFQYFKKIL